MRKTTFMSIFMASMIMFAGTAISRQRTNTVCLMTSLPFTT